MRVRGHVKGTCSLSWSRALIDRKNNSKVQEDSKRNGRRIEQRPSVRNRHKHRSPKHGGSVAGTRSCKDQRRARDDNRNSAQGIKVVARHMRDDLPRSAACGCSLELLPRRESVSFAWRYKKTLTSVVHADSNNRRDSSVGVKAIFIARLGVSQQFPG